MILNLQLNDFSISQYPFQPSNGLIGHDMFVIDEEAQGISFEES